MLHPASGTPKHNCSTSETSKWSKLFSARKGEINEIQNFHYFCLKSLLKFDSKVQISNLVDKVYASLYFNGSYRCRIILIR